MRESIATLWHEERARFQARLRHLSVTREMMIRMLADMVLVNLALAIAMAGRCLWALGLQGTQDSAEVVIRTYLDTFALAGTLLTATSLLVFAIGGLYTHGRAYRIRYKMITIARVVSVAFLLFGLEVLLLRDMMPFARSTLLAAWLLTMMFMAGARLYATTWTTGEETAQQTARQLSAQREAPRILIVGGAGYIGSALTRRLLELGYRVRVLDLLMYGDEPIRRFYSDSNFELIRGDFRHIDAVVEAAKGVDSIVHLGAIVGDSACKLCGELTVEINLRATRTIAEVGKGFGVRRFVFASTCSVYGASNETLDEHSALNPISLYARTKVASEQVLLNLADGDFAPVILRFGTVYGLSGRPRFDLVVNLLAAKAIQDGEVGIVGGQQWRPFVHVSDVAEAIRLVLEAPKASVCGQVFNVGSNEQNYQIADLGKLIAEMVPSARVITEPKEDDRNYRVRFDKIHNVLSFRPDYTVPQGITQIVEAFSTGQIQDYRDPRFNNLSFLSNHDELRRALVEDGQMRDGVTRVDLDSAAGDGAHGAPTGRSELSPLAAGGVPA